VLNIWNYTDLKTRFRAKSEKLKAKPVTPTTAAARSRKQGNRLHFTFAFRSDVLVPVEYQEAPALPLPEGAQPAPKSQLAEMEDFLDDLLS